MWGRTRDTGDARKAQLPGQTVRQGGHYRARLAHGRQALDRSIAPRRH